MTEKRMKRAATSDVVEVINWSHVRPLICSGCGNPTRGRQWQAQPKGYGICRRCVNTRSEGVSLVEFERAYGKAGIHHSLPSEV